MAALVKEKAYTKSKLDDEDHALLKTANKIKMAHGVKKSRVPVDVLSGDEEATIEVNGPKVSINGSKLSRTAARTPVNKPSGKVSHQRDEARKLKRPLWNKEVDTEKTMARRPAQAKLVTISDSEPDAAPSILLWATITESVLEQDGSMQLRQQNAHVHAVMQLGFKKVVANVCFADAFPDGSGKIAYLRKTLAQCVRDLGEHKIKTRLLEDYVYARPWLCAAKTRMCCFRKDIKQASSQLVSLQYDLCTGNRAARHKLETHKPYQHPIIIDIIHSQIFKGQNSVALVHPQMFESVEDGEVFPDVSAAHEDFASHGMLQDTVLSAALLEIEQAALAADDTQLGHDNNDNQSGSDLDDDLDKSGSDSDDEPAPQHEDDEPDDKEQRAPQMHGQVDDADGG
ncbi:hypothetical protein B0H21DRAFT_822624 [Amylocystis lapponica]|nr:hypothetical protein B0H21DRAFT_822624 [Amylocystis lapponica]